MHNKTHIHTHNINSSDGMLKIIGKNTLTRIHTQRHNTHTHIKIK